MSINSLFSNIDIVRTNAKEKIKKVYYQNDRPWILGYSGGKDSSTVVHLVMETIAELPELERTKRIYVVSSDTLVENPLIKLSLLKSHRLIESAAKAKGINLTTHLVHPRYDDTFWVNIIGKGYPSPNQTFRWCTDRMKISPTNEFIKRVVDEQGEVIMLLGVRRGESNSRDRVLDSHSVEQSLLMRHTTLQNAYVFAPIIDFTIDNVWSVLLDSPSPWGADNRELWRLYSDSSNAMECPLIVDESIKETAGSCGNSRFGCWVCTVVNKDKSLTGFINTGTSWLKNLLEFRNWLTIIRDDRSMRSKHRTNGAVYFTEIEAKNDSFIISKKSAREKLTISKVGNEYIDQNGQRWIVKNSKNEALQYISYNNITLDTNEDPHILAIDHEKVFLLGLGPFTIETRKEILRRLLRLERENSENLNGERLIQLEELKEIARIWLENGVWDQSIKEIYEQEKDEPFPFAQDEITFLDDDSLNLLGEICTKYDIDFTLLSRLLYVEKNNIGLVRRNSVIKMIGKILNQDNANL
jgi:DNA sulfur modification protein DndC